MNTIINSKALAGITGADPIQDLTGLVEGISDREFHARTVVAKWCVAPCVLHGGIKTHVFLFNLNIR